MTEESAIPVCYRTIYIQTHIYCRRLILAPNFSQSWFERSTHGNFVQTGGGGGEEVPSANFINSHTVTQQLVDGGDRLPTIRVKSNADEESCRRL
jgi:hypothetical protein